MKLIDMEALKYFYSKLEQIFSGVTVTIKPQVFTDEQKAQARANIGAGSADFTGDYEELINKPNVAGQSSINAGKTIKSWSETDGKVAITTQDIEIVKEQISDFAHTHTVEDITDLDGMNFATEQYVADAIEALPSPMVFKGSLGTDGTITTLPNAVKANTGHTYKVITDNTYSGQKAKSGDMFISDGSKWVYIPSADEEGGVTSVNVSVPTGLSVSGVPITTSGTIAITNEDGYSIPTDAKQTQWDKAFTHSESDHARVDATKVEASETNGNIKIDGVETTVYEHPTQLAKTSDMYKIAVDGTGHVSNAVTATASDLTYSNTDSGLKATNVQEAIDEVNEDVTTLQTEMPNKADKSDIVGVNLLPYPYTTGSMERDGLTWTVEDGTVSVNGTNTSTTTSGINFVYDPNEEYICKLDKKKYIFHAKGNNIPDNSMFIWIRPVKEDGTYPTITKYFKNDYAGIIIDNTGGEYVYARTLALSVSKDKTVDVENIHVQLEEGDTPHSYRPYTLNNQLEELRETKANKTEISNMVKAPQVAEVGQVLSVKTVDSEGKPTEWETVDKPEDGGVPETTWLKLGFNKKLVWDATEAAKYNWGKRPVYGRAMTAASNTNSSEFLCFFLLNLNDTDLTIYGVGASTTGSSTTGTTNFGYKTFKNNNSMGDMSGYIGLPTSIVERLNIRVE